MNSNASNPNQQNKPVSFRKDIQQAKKEGIICLVIALILIGAALTTVMIAIITKIDYDRFDQKAVYVQATCTRVWSERHSHKSGKTRTTTIHYYADVSYEYEGYTYSHSKVTVDSYTGTGSVISVRINPDNPWDCRESYSLYRFFIAFAVAGIIAVIGAVFVWGGIKTISGVRKARLKGDDYVEIVPL